MRLILFAKEELLKAVVEHRVESIRGLLEEWSLDCGTPYDCLEGPTLPFNSRCRVGPCPTKTRCSNHVVPFIPGQIISMWIIHSA